MEPRSESSASLLQLVKKGLPGPIRKLARRCFNYSRRIAFLSEVFLKMSGVTSADRSVLRRSIFYGPILLAKNLDQWVEPFLVADATISVKGLGTFAVRGNTDDLGHIRPRNLSRLLECVSRQVREGDTVIDAGANIGGVTVHMSRCVGKTGNVLAIEMLPETAMRLRRTIALSKLSNVKIVEQALADTEGETITAFVPAGGFGLASIINSAKCEMRRIDVHTTTLDAATHGMGEIALIKMDLEGAEPQALAGAKDTLKRTRALIFESWTGGQCEASQILRSAGFESTPIDGRNFLAVKNGK
jgi:FkbM family methyltransferase